MQSYRIYVIVAGRNMRPLFYWAQEGDDKMIIVPLEGDIFRANVESYIILEWGLGFSADWEGFLKDVLGNGIRFINNSGEAVERSNAYRLHSNVLTLDPQFDLPSYKSLKYLYFLKGNGSLRSRLFAALSALNDKQVASVAFNGDRARNDQAVINTGRILDSWETEKMENKEPVYIKQVSLVCKGDYFRRNILPHEPMVNPVFRPRSR